MGGHIFFMLDDELCCIVVFVIIIRIVFIITFVSFVYVRYQAVAYIEASAFIYQDGKVRSNSMRFISFLNMHSIWKVLQLW